MVEIINPILLLIQYCSKRILNRRELGQNLSLEKCNANKILEVNDDQFTINSRKVTLEATMKWKLIEDL